MSQGYQPVGPGPGLAPAPAPAATVAGPAARYAITIGGRTTEVSVAEVLRCLVKTA